MDMSRDQRFELKSEILDEVINYDGPWTFARQNLLLGEFNLPTLNSGFNQDMGFEDAIAGISDEALIQMYRAVLKKDPRKYSIPESDESKWKDGRPRVFLSHSAVYKAFVDEVAEELEAVGIHGFVAHTSMEISKPWQTQIETALKTMQAFVALVHPEFNMSAWCQQEVGWAMGRGVPRLAIRFGADPRGFLGSDQGAPGSQRAREVAGTITNWMMTVPQLAPNILDGLLAALRDAGSYIDSGAAAERIAHFTALTDEHFKELERIFWDNSQVNGGGKARRALERLYITHNRQWPPTAPDQ